MKKFLSALIAGAMLLSSMTAWAEEIPADVVDDEAVEESTEVDLPDYGFAVLEGEDLLVKAEPIQSGKAKNFRLDAGMEFSVVEDDVEDSYYADWLVDWEIEFAQDTTAQLMGAYESIRDGEWQFADSIDFEAGETYRILKDSGLDEIFADIFDTENTYAAIAEYVGTFKCGIVFDKATTEDGAEVTVNLCLYNPETDERVVVCSEDAEYSEIAMPDYAVSALEGDELEVDAEGVVSGYVSGTLDVGLKFEAMETVEEAQEAVYANWIPEYEIEFSEDTTAQLMGAYENIDDGTWQSLGSYDFEGGKTYKIMEESGLDEVFDGLFEGYNYANIVEYVNVFKCGVMYESVSFGTDVTLRLTVTDDFSGDEYVLFEETYTVGSIFETTDTDEEIAEVINNLPVEDVAVYAESIKEVIAELDQESKDALSAEVIKTLVADQIEEDATEVKVYSADSEITVTAEDVTDDDADAFVAFDIVAEKDGEVLDSVQVPVLVAIPLPAGTVASDIESVVHEHVDAAGKVTYKTITNYFVENDILYFHMSEFSVVTINFKAVPVTGGAVLKLVESADQVAGSAKYDVVLEGDSADAIKYLVSGEFKVNVASTDAYDYDFAVNYPEQTSAHKEAGDVWHFELNSFDENTSWTKDVVDNKLTIGTLTVTARGTGSVSLSNVLMAKNDGTSSNGAVAIETTAGNAQAYDIEPAKYELTIDVEFYNEIAENDDNDMTVTISGGDLEAPITKKIAQNVQGVTYDAATCTYTFKANLSEYTEYCVTVEGEGYRKAVYYVDMQDTDKRLHFWNNAEDVAEVIEIGADAATAVNANFLAGDIVADNEINIYDLSAVVSYFGEEDIVAGDKYVKYDLNRDGKIDSMDVAYVLVSWGF